jgi:rare lipoprotein A
MLFVKQEENYKIMKNSIIVFSVSLLLVLITGFSTVGDSAPAKTKTEKQNIAVPLFAALKVADSIKAVKIDSTETVTAEPKLTLYKKDVLATYYADKFNGRKTTSGERFHNAKYTAAHMKLPFGTMVRVTNENNGKWVDVKVNDRGPFSKKLEIDLTKKAFMDIASRKNCGTFKVKIEIIE